MSEYSMYVCPECRKVFKVKGNNKKAKCPKCTNSLLSDMNIADDEWGKLNADTKKSIIDAKVKAASHTENPKIQYDEKQYKEELEKEIRKNDGKPLKPSQIFDFRNKIEPYYSVAISEIEIDMTVILRKISKECDRRNKNENITVNSLPKESGEVSKKADTINKTNESKDRVLTEHLESVNPKTSFFDDVNSKKGDDANTKELLSAYTKSIETASVKSKNKIHKNIFDIIKNNKPIKIAIIVIILSCIIIPAAIASENRAKMINSIKSKICEKRMANKDDIAIINIDKKKKSFDLIVHEYRNKPEPSSIFYYLNEEYYNGMKMRYFIYDPDEYKYCIGDQIETDGSVSKGILLFRNDNAIFNNAEYERIKKEEEEARKEQERKEQERAKLTGQSSSTSSSHKSSSSSSGSNYSSKGSSETVSADDKDLYYYIAQQEVKKYLKSPSSAKFPYVGNDGVSVKKEGDLVTIVAWVEADNSFGAAVRNVFIVELKLNGTKYSVQSVTVL